MNFFHEWFLILEQKSFGFSAKNIRPTSQHYIPRIQVHFQSWKCFFDRTFLSFSFFRNLIEKSCQFLEESFQRSSFPEEISPKKRFLEKCPWVFFGPWANRISEFWKSFQHGGWGVRKTIHVSRVLLGGKLIFGSNINLLIEKWQIVPTVSEVCWELLSMVVKLHFSCREE